MPAKQNKYNVVDVDALRQQLGEIGADLAADLCELHRPLPRHPASHRPRLLGGDGLEATRQGNVFSVCNRVNDEVLRR